MAKKVQILSSDQARVKLERIAYEIVENNLDHPSIVLAGIRERGYVLATLLKKNIEKISQLKVELIHVNLDRNHPMQGSIDGEQPSENAVIILVDDVANSGSTLLYAMRLFLEQLPHCIKIAVLVDRTHKRFPVTSDYIGLTLSTTLQDHIHVEISKGEVKQAYLE